MGGWAVIKTQGFVLFAINFVGRFPFSAKQISPLYSLLGNQSSWLQFTLFVQFFHTEGSNVQKSKL